MTKNLANLIISIRPKQWTKNLILYIALPFSVSQLWAVGDLDQLTILLIKISAGFIVFCAISGSVYIINDIFDDNRYDYRRTLFYDIVFIYFIGSSDNY